MAAVINRVGWGFGLRLWIAIGFWGLMACAGSPQPAGQGPISLAVWDLEDLSPMVHGQAGMGEILSGQIAARFAQNTGFQMVERQQLLKAIEELHVGSSDLGYPETRLRLGRLIGARQMVFGAFQVIGPSLRLDLRRVEVASGKILKTASATVASADLNQWLSAADEAALVLIAP